MSIIAFGTNHKYSTIEIREKFYFPKKHLKEALANLINYYDIRAAAILSTCNRVEIYASVSKVEEGLGALREFLSDYHREESASITSSFYTYIGEEAIRHLFSVASGLDSQILGENQISGQVSFAYKEAKAFEATDKLLDIIFEKAIEVSSKVRLQTDISKDDLSIADIVSDLIRAKTGPISDKKILIIGVGKVTELIIERLKREGAIAVFVANRTYEKACELARRMGAEVVGFEELKERLKNADIVISATSSPHLVIRKEALEEAIGSRPSAVSNKVLIIDLALPRDIDHRAREIEEVELFDLDDLNPIIEKNIGNRRLETQSARLIIDREVDTIWERLIGLEREEALLPSNKSKRS